jgi:hypothetical protein
MDCDGILDGSLLSIVVGSLEDIADGSWDGNCEGILESSLEIILDGD